MEKTPEQINLVTVGFAALLCAMGLNALKGNAAKKAVDERLIAKKNSVISCTSIGSSVTTRSWYHYYNDTPSEKDSQPGNNSDRNSCPHQQGASSLCDMNGSRRRIFKTPSC